MRRLLQQAGQRRKPGVLGFARMGLQDLQKIGVSLAESGFNGQFTIAELLGTITGTVPGQAGIFAVSIAVVLISYGISVRFMEKREI